MKNKFQKSPKDSCIDSPVQAERSSGINVQERGSGIIESIQKNRPAHVELPEILFSTRDTFLNNEDLVKSFIENLKLAGGEVSESMPSGPWIDFGLDEVKSNYPADCPLDQLYELETIVLNGRFGVAENGAIWIEETDVSHRLIPFVAQHIIIRLDKKEIVYDMHEAYRRIQLQETGFGVFISGPSKTADIEQHLVYGAHGARSLVVVLIWRII